MAVPASDTVASASPGTPAAGAPSSSWLAHVPVPLFAAVMGLAGLGLAWRRAHEVLGWPAAVGKGVLGLAALAFVAIALLYLAKAVRHGPAVAAEFAHPVRASFVPTLSIALLLLGTAALPYHRGLAEGLWLVGTAVHLLLSIVIFRRWITASFTIQHINPAWFIPVVGNILVPLAGVRLGYAELSWFFFSVGLVFWGILFTVVIYRIIFHDPLPARLLPTLFILMAPPAIGFAAWLQLNGGQLDLLAHLLVSTALFIALLLLSMAPRFLKVPFFVSWWAYTFPSAALAIAGLLYHQLAPGAVTAALASALLLAATGIIAVVTVRTLGALAAGRLFVPE